MGRLYQEVLTQHQHGLRAPHQVRKPQLYCSSFGCTSTLKLPDREVSGEILTKLLKARKEKQELH